MSQDHTWTKLNREHGVFWICKVCAMSAGPAKDGDTEPGYLYGGGFLAGTPLDQLGYDCKESQVMVAEYILKYPNYAEVLETEYKMMMSDITRHTSALEDVLNTPIVAVTVKDKKPLVLITMYMSPELAMEVALRAETEGVTKGKLMLQLIEAGLKLPASHLSGYAVDKK